MVEHDVDVGLGFVELSAGVSDLGCGLILAAFQFGHGDGVAQVGVDEFRLGPFQGLESFGLLGDDALGFAGVDFEVVVDALLDVGDEGLVEGFVEPVLLHDGFDAVDGDVWELAVVALLVATEAEEVAVAFAVFAGGFREAESLPAAGTPEAAHQVVALFPAAIPRDSSRHEDRLHAVPGDIVDECLVFAFVDDTFVDDFSRVVRAGQDAVQLAAIEGRRGEFGGGSGSHTAVGEFIDEIGDGVVTGGVTVESPGDVRAAFGVDDDRLDFVAFDAGGGVEVPEWRIAGGSTAEGLLVHPFSGFVAEVVGVELGDAGHDRVQQHPTGRVVDCFGD